MSELAVRLINEAYKRKATFLDLGNCGLTEIPFDILKLKDTLQELNFGSSYWTGNREKHCANHEKKNDFSETQHSFERLIQFHKLVALRLSDVGIREKGAEYIGRLAWLIDLDLSNNGIGDKAAEYIGRLSKLTDLNLQGNQIREEGAEYIGRLSALTNLKLRGNQIGDNGVEYISRLSALTNLDLSGNQIDDNGVGYICRLSVLINLDLSNNNIGDNGAKYISSLTTLTNLSLSDNEIGDTGAEYISRLSALTDLEIAGNQIGDNGAKHIGKLSALTFLDLSYNYIGDNGAEYISRLNALNLLWLRGNQIGDKGAEHISSIFSLEELSLANNKIRMPIGFQKLRKLFRLFLDKNEIIDITVLDFLIAKQDSFLLYIDANPFIKEYGLNLRSFENHLPFIKELLQRHLDTSAKKICRYPIKILMLGNHGAGKSALVNYLTGKKDKGSTHILRIENYQQGKNDEDMLPKAILFDFGGQDFYHGIYQAFISDSALQLILFDAERDDNGHAMDSNGIPTVHFNRRYWLGQKTYRDRGNSAPSPYLMVQTYAERGDDEVSPLNYSFYPGYKKGFSLSLCPGEKAAQLPDKDVYEAARLYFKAYLDGLLKKMQQDTEKEEPEWYLKFLQYIYNKEDKGHAAVKVSKVLNEYVVKGWSPEKRMESLTTNLITLHRHGLVLYYPQIKDLEDVVWLDPQKLVAHIQEQILNKKSFDVTKHNTPGVIPKADFERKVQDRKLVLLLQQQKIIFLHKPTGKEEDEEYIIPNFLPLMDKGLADMQLFTFGLSKADFVLKFNDFIPFGFINQLICFFGKQPDVKKFWRNQLLFTLDSKARVLIELDFEQLKIKVHLQLLDKADVSEEKDIMTYLFFCILGLYWNLDNEQIRCLPSFPKHKDDKTVFKELIEKSLPKDTSFAPRDLYISVDDVRYIKYSDLVSLTRDDYKINSYTIRDGLIDEIAVDKTTTLPFLPFAVNKLNAMKKVFVAYSKQDEDYLEDFENHLVTLKNNGVAVFNCRKIEFGKEWDEEIKKQLDDCDIMVCLVSVHFLNTEYITKVEIPRAMDKGKIIVPIIIKACDWEESEIGKYQAAQKGKVVSLDNEAKLLGKIRSHDQVERDAFWTGIVKEFRQKLLLP